MEIKKYPSAILENYSKILIQLGFVLALFVVYEFFKMKSYHEAPKALSGSIVSTENTEQIVEIKPLEIEVKPTIKAIIPEKIFKVEDDIEIQETIIESTETDESEAITVRIEEKFIDVEEEAEEVIEDVPFLVIEEIPVFPGCTGTQKELRSCFSQKIATFVLKKFNAEIASDLGLPAGSIQKIFVLFRIDKNGNITNIKARAPHKQLQKEAIRVIMLLPKMTPGKQRGKPVGVSYALPITFKVA